MRTVMSRGVRRTQPRHGAHRARVAGVREGTLEGGPGTFVFNAPFSNSDGETILVEVPIEGAYIRGDFAHVSYGYADEKGIGVKNLIHASADKKDAEVEVPLWFEDKEIHSYKTVHDAHILE